MLNPLLIAMAAAALLSLWIFDRNRLARQLASVSDRQRRLEIVLNGFMEESERITHQFSRLIGTAPARHEPASSQPKNNGVEKKHLVMSLAQKGTTVSEIAERMMMPAGEVELILNLSRSKRTVKSA